MTIEELIKVNSPLGLPKKTLLSILYSQIVITEKFSEVLKPYELSEEQFNVLRILRGQKEHSANMCVIQERMIAKTSNTTRLVDKLLLKQLVTREVCPGNRRKIDVKITGKGLSILAELDPKIIDLESSFASNLSEPELELLNILLEKYRTLNN